MRPRGAPKDCETHYYEKARLTLGRAAGDMQVEVGSMMVKHH